MQAMEEWAGVQVRANEGVREVLLKENLALFVPASWE
jgi:hypothetical protein